ncbi:MAG: exodeoxyribonuclease VII large subunit [Candidatus Thioglobus sp. MED-G25]|nr:MAG: exodeoxyribonuclease VII large subunit [Candidatus Thioglobus sp. MED-G25]
MLLDRVFSVSEFTRSIRDLLEESYPEVWIRGEISNLATPRSGHAYFSLKDENSQVRCALFRTQRLRLAVPLAEGTAVLIRGKPSIYLGRGDFQMIVDYVEPAGEGELRRRYEQLKVELERQGLFDPAIKRALPTMPKRIGVVTSSTGAAVHDILTTLARRFATAEVLVLPVAVQGDDSVPSIVNALDQIGQSSTCEIVILARGGGSLEDLWAFNEASIVHAIRACPVPVITGIGHETDFTLADFAADFRAATPTAAAEAGTPDTSELYARLAGLSNRISLATLRMLQDRGQVLDASAGRLHHPRARLSSQRHQLRAQQTRLHSAVRDPLYGYRLALTHAIHQLHVNSPVATVKSNQVSFQALLGHLQRLGTTIITSHRQQIGAAGGALEILNPRRTLGRGYAIVKRVSDGAIVTSALDTTPGDPLITELRRGSVSSTVTGINKHLIGPTSNPTDPD